MTEETKPTELPPTRELYDRLDAIDTQIDSLQTERSEVAKTLRSRLGRK